MTLMEMIMRTMTFRTPAQAAIFACELIGQFSDGFWENSTRGDWETWCDTNVTHGSNVGRDFHTSYDKYNLSAKSLLDVVQLRMIGYARLAIKFGYELAIALQWAVDYDGMLVNLDGDDEYYAKRRTEQDEIFARHHTTKADVVRALAEVPYGTKQLRKDLTEMKLAMKITSR